MPLSLGYFLPFVSWIHPEGHKPGRVALARNDKCGMMGSSLPLTFINNKWQTH